MTKSNFKSKQTGRVFPYIGTFLNNEGKTCYKTGQYSGWEEKYIEFTNEPVWIEISFNLRLRYNEACDCVAKIEEIGGSGGIVPGGSYYVGSKDMINKLLVYMGEKDYDLDSMSFKSPQEAAKDRVKELKYKGIIK